MSAHKSVVVTVGGVIKVVVADVETVLELLGRVPDFSTSVSLETVVSRVGEQECLALVALDADIPVGVKFGYTLDDTVFYSWLGGVLPHARRRGVAAALLDAQHRWVRSGGRSTIRVKSMNRYPDMVRFLVGQGYRIVGTECSGHPDDMKILFERTLD